MNGSAVARYAIVLAGSVTIAGCFAGCTARHFHRSDYGVRRCPSTAAADLLSVDALECWFDAPHGRWRTVSRESHYDVLVIHVEALNLRDADDIARRFVADKKECFSEILVYARAEGTASSPRIRRVRWTRDGGFEAFDFSAPADP